MFDINRVLKETGKHKAKRIFLQAPEGLKTRLQEIARQLEKKGLEVFISCEPCFGSCDIREHDAKTLGCDVLLHLGHTDFGVKSELPVIYEPYEIEHDVKPELEKHIPELKRYCW